MRAAGSSAPAPDGLPYGAWKSLGEVAVEVLWQAAEQLRKEDNREMLGQAYDDSKISTFNHSLICCILGKPIGADSSGGL